MVDSFFFSLCLNIHCACKVNDRRFFLTYINIHIDISQSLILARFLMIILLFFFFSRGDLVVEVVRREDLRSGDDSSAGVHHVCGYVSICLLVGSRI